MESLDEEECTTLSYWIQKLVSLEKDMILKEQQTKTEPLKHEYYTCEDN